MAGRTTALGYGWDHQKRRQVVKQLLASQPLPCTRCPDLVYGWQKWHLDHAEDRSGYLGVAHAACNLRAGARKGYERMREDLRRELRRELRQEEQQREGGDWLNASREW
jgi:hypothetical protein